MRYNKYIKKTIFFLILILFVKVGGYYTISENISITRVFKIISRIMMTIGTIYILNQLKKKNIYAFIHIKFPLPLILYGGFLFLAMVSFLWSTKPSYSILQWVMYLDSFVFSYFYIKAVLILQFHYKEKINLSDIFSKALSILSLIFLIGFKISPDKFLRATHGGEVERLGGYFMNPNELGMMSVVGIATAIISFTQNKSIKTFILLLTINLLTLVLTGSRSSMIGFMLIILYLISRSNNIKLKLSVYGLMVASVPLIINFIFIKQGDIKEVLSMTGRLPFWSALLNEGIIKEPWLGFGFMRIAYTDSFESVHTYAGKMTHNTFIQVLMNLGFIGLFIAVFQVISTLRIVLKATNRIHRVFFVGVFIPIIINSFTEFGIFGESNFGTLFFQLLVFVLCLKPRTKLSRKEFFLVNKSSSKNK